MFINVKQSLITAETFFENVENINSPSVLLDSSFRIIAKTKAVNGFLKGVRKGTKISKFLSDEAVFEIENMTDESVFRTEIFTETERFSVVVVSKDGYRLVIFDRLFAEVFKTANDVYRKMSGYDNGFDGKDNLFSSRTNKLKDLLGGIIDSFKTPNGLPFFDASPIVSCVVSTVLGSSVEFRERIVVNLPKERFTTSGNDRDFAAATVLLVSYALKNRHDVSVSLVGNSGKIKLSIAGKQNFGFGTTINLRNFLQASADVGEFEFLIYLTKLIADANLWDFEISEDESGFPCFNLLMPLLKNGEEFLLREDVFKFIEELVNTITE